MTDRNRPELWSSADTLRPDRSPDPDTEAAAIRAVLHRYETGADTAAQSLTILLALGLVGEEPAQESRLPSAAAQARRRRRKAARERAREENGGAA